MFFKMQTPPSTGSSWDSLDRLRALLDGCDALVIGAGAGLSAAAGFDYGGDRFDAWFSDFRDRYGITDMYSGGFYPFPGLEEYWAWWSRHIYCNRYIDPPKPVYRDLLELVRDKDYFVLTTNVDHCFQRAGFDKNRLFYTQGDYGLLQCSLPCHRATYDNEALVRRMVDEQRDLRVPSELVPRCPRCGRPMTVNLRCDATFVEDPGWHAASRRYAAFLQAHRGQKLLFLELGVGGNTPAIIKYPFQRMAAREPGAHYVQIDLSPSGAFYAPAERTLLLRGDIGQVLERLAEA